MSKVLDVQMTDKGLLVPREAIEGWGEIEAILEGRRIVIHPKSLTARISGFIDSPLSIKEILDDYENSFLDDYDLLQLAGER